MMTIPGAVEGQRPDCRNFYGQGTYPRSAGPSGGRSSSPSPPVGNYWSRISRKVPLNWMRDGRIWWGKSDNNHVLRSSASSTDVQEGLVVPQTIWTSHRK